MPQLTTEYIKARLEDINKQGSQKELEFNKYLFYEGSNKDLIKKAIVQEFKKIESIEGLFARVLPLNMMKKIINKLGATYLEGPTRLADDGNPDDQELIGLYEDAMNIDVQMRVADRYFELNKKTLVEPYVDSLGYPRLRTLPAYSYFCFSTNPISPEVPDCIFKIIKADKELGKVIYAVWTDKQFLIIDGYGTVSKEAMTMLNNVEGVNPYGIIPFCYMVDSGISVEPVQEDDLYNICLSIPILLTDLSFGSKFMAYSLIWTVDCNADIPAGAGAVLHLSSDPATGKSPSVNQLKPEIDINSNLQLTESLVSYLLSTRGLKTDTISGKLNANDAASGIAKIIDNSELAIINKSKQTNFVNLEKKLWKMISKNLHPIWKKQGLLDPKFTQEFSSAFEISIHFQEPKIVMSEKEKIELAKLKLDSGLTTLKRELTELYPTYSEDQIDQLIEEIQGEKKSNMEQFFQKNDNVEDKSDNEDDSMMNDKNNKMNDSKNNGVLK